MSNIITLGFDEQTGDPIEYKKLSARLPEFLRSFPPSAGYRVVVDYFDPIEVKPGLSKLYQACLTAGNKPSDMGLPALAANTMIFRANLLDDQGRVVGSGSALKHIQGYKDWEKGETAARQRLLAALGFGGDILDADEFADQADQGFSPQKGRQQSRLSSIDAPAMPEVSERAANNQPSVPTDGAVDEQRHQPEQPQVTVEQEAGEGHSSDIPASMLATIEHHAAIRNEPVPRLGSKKEASEFLKKLCRAA